MAANKVTNDFNSTQQFQG